MKYLSFNLPTVVAGYVIFGMDQYSEYADNEFLLKNIKREAKQILNNCQN
jgi:hypothetical protein